MDDISVTEFGSLNIIQQPASQTVECNVDVTFSVAVDGSPSDYQWYRGATPLTGETGTSISFTNVQASDSGTSVYVVVTDGFSSVTSSVATLTVFCTGLIHNGGFEIAGAIGSQNNSIPEAWHEIVNSFGRWGAASPGQPPHGGNFVMHAGAASGNGGEYQDIITTPGQPYVLNFWAVGWLTGEAQQSGLVQVGTPGGMDTDLTLNNNAEYVNTTFVVPRFDDAAAWTLFTFLFTPATETTRITFQNLAPSAVNIDDVSVTLPPPLLITNQPASVMTQCGSNVNFSVGASASSALSYQWYWNSNLLAGATNALLTLTNVQATDSGKYFAVVNDSSESVTSTVATLTVSCFGLVVNGDFELAGPNGSIPAGWNEIINSYGRWRSGIVDRGPYEGAYSMQPGANQLAGGAYQDIPTEPGQRYKLDFWAVGMISRPTWQNGLVQVGTPGAIDNDLTLNNYAEYVNAELSLPPLSGSVSWTPFTYTFTAETELTRISFQGRDGSDILVDLVTLELVPASLLVITNPPVSQSAICGNNVTFSVGVDSAETLYYQWFFDNKALPNATDETLILEQVQAAQAGNYFVVVRDSSQSVTSKVAQLTVDCTGLLYNGGFELEGPSGTQNNPIPEGWHEIINSFGRWGAVPPGQPTHGGQYVMHAGASSGNGGEYQDITTEPGQQYVLTFWAVGWLTGDALQSGIVQVGTPGGADNDLAANNNAEYVNTSFTVPRFDNAAAWTQFTYLFTAATETTRVSFQNVAPSAVNIDDASVFPAQSLLIIDQPASQAALCGGSATFSVGAQGTPPLSYQWYWGGAAIAGATLDTLSLSGLQAPDSGGYSVVVSDTSGSVTSLVATLTVSCFGMVNNGGFETAGPNGSQNNSIPEGWHEIVNSYGRWGAVPPGQPPHGGRYVMHVGASGNNGGEYQDLVTEPGRQYVLTFWAVGWLTGADAQSGIVQAGTAGGNPNDLAQNNNAEYVNSTFQVPKFSDAASWTRFGYAFTAATDSTRISFQNVAPGAISIDDVSLDIASRLSIAPQAGEFILRWSGTPGRLYEVQTAPAIAGPWTAVKSLVAGEDGAMEYQVSPAAMVFYRTVAP